MTSRPLRVAGTAALILAFAGTALVLLSLIALLLAPPEVKLILWWWLYQ